MDKKQWTRPEVRSFGTVEQLTQQGCVSIVQGKICGINDAVNHDVGGPFIDPRSIGS
jgi:hypothetical protein